MLRGLDRAIQYLWLHNGHVEVGVRKNSINVFERIYIRCFIEKQERCLWCVFILKKEEADLGGTDGQTNECITA